MQLIDVVSKKASLPCGIFGNISDDLGFIQNLDQLPPMIRMSYAYARRAVAAGLFLQGVFTYDQFLYVNRIFKQMQVLTGHTVEFQDEACRHAIDLLKTYDQRLDFNFVATITRMALHNDYSVDQYPQVDYETCIAHIYQCINKVKEDASISVNNRQNVQKKKYTGLIKFFLVLGCFVDFLFYIIPGIIALPIAIMVWGKLNNTKPIGIGLKIMTLIFVSLIAGILLLTTDKSHEQITD